MKYCLFYSYDSYYYIIPVSLKTYFMQLDNKLNKLEKDDNSSNFEYHELKTARDIFNIYKINSHNTIFSFSFENPEVLKEVE